MQIKYACNWQMKNVTYSCVIAHDTVEILIMKGIIDCFSHEKKYF
jgi:hypothetical protein